MCLSRNGWINEALTIKWVDSVCRDALVSVTGSSSGMHSGIHTGRHCKKSYSRVPEKCTN